MTTEAEWKVHTVFGDSQPTDDEDFLFHYTSTASAAGIALTGNLLLSPLDRLNDPQEAIMRSLVTTTLSTNRNVAPRAVGDVEGLGYEAALGLHRDAVRVGCFTMDAANGEPGTLRRHDERGYARQRTWTQYGAGHSGVCFVLDRRKLVANAKRAFGSLVKAGAVTYIQGFNPDLHMAELTDFDNPNPRAHFLSRVIPALFSKNADWAAEREFRLVVHEWDDSPCELPFDGVVTGVVLGATFEADRIPTAQAISRVFEVEDSTCILMYINQVLVAMPIIGADGNWHRWTDQELRRPGLVFGRQN